MMGCSSSHQRRTTSSGSGTRCWNRMRTTCQLLYLRCALKPWAEVTMSYKSVVRICAGSFWTRLTATRQCKQSRCVTPGIQSLTRTQKRSTDVSDSPALCQILGPISCLCTISWLMMGAWCMTFATWSWKCKLDGGWLCVTWLSAGRIRFGC